MSRLRIDGRRLFWDFVVTLILFLLLSILFTQILDLDLIEIAFNLILLSIALDLVILTFHSVLCQSNGFFWMFAFLLPDEMYYYIFANIKPNGANNLKLIIKDSPDIVSSKPMSEKTQRLNKSYEFLSLEIYSWLFSLPTLDGINLADFIDISKQADNCENHNGIVYSLIRKTVGLLCNIANRIKTNRKELIIVEKSVSFLRKSSALKSTENTLQWPIKESKSIVLLLRGEGNKFLEILNKNQFDLNESQYGKTCSGLNNPYLLFSKNVILLLTRSLLLTVLFMFILMQNPPLMIAIEPSQVQENYTEGDGHFVVISVKNIGCDLLNPILWNMSSSKRINASWNNISSNFAHGDIRFINISIDRECPPGEYVGSILIEAKANRSISYPINHTYIIGQTSAKKLAEVPFIFRIMPK